MHRRRTLHLTLGIAVFLIAVQALGSLGNRSPRTAATSIYLPADGSGFLDPGAMSRTSGVNDTAWFNTFLTDRHSYEIQVYNVGAPTSAGGPNVWTLSFFQGNGTTAYSASTVASRTANNPYQLNCPGVYGAAGSICSGGSRYTTVVTAGSNQYMVLRVNPNLNVDNDFGYYAIRITDTTLQNPWYFIAGDYNAFSEISNASDQTVNITVTFFTAAGNFIDSVTMALAANANVAINAADYVNRLTVSSGSITIAHDGGWGDIVAGCTTLSSTTGLSFDSYFQPVHGPKLGSSFATNY